MFDFVTLIVRSSHHVNFKSDRISGKQMNCGLIFVLTFASKAFFLPVLSKLMEMKSYLCVFR